MVYRMREIPVAIKERKTPITLRALLFQFPTISASTNIFCLPLLFTNLAILLSNLFQPSTIENPPLFSVDTPLSLQVEQTEVLVTPPTTPSHHIR